MFDALVAGAVGKPVEMRLRGSNFGESTGIIAKVEGDCITFLDIYSERAPGDKGISWSDELGPIHAVTRYFRLSDVHDVRIRERSEPIDGDRWLAACWAWLDAQAEMHPESPEVQP
jgi:hypothetical protein